MVVFAAALRTFTLRRIFNWKLSVPLGTSLLCCNAAKHSNRLNGLVCSLASCTESRTALLSGTCPPGASQSMHPFGDSTFFLSAAAIQIVVSFLSPFSPKAPLMTSEGSLFNLAFVIGRSPRYQRTAGSPARLHSAGLWTGTHQGKRQILRASLLSPSPLFFQNTFHRLAVVESLPSRKTRVTTAAWLQHVPNAWNNDARSGGANCCEALSHRFRMDAAFDKY